MTTLEYIIKTGDSGTRMSCNNHTYDYGMGIRSLLSAVDNSLCSFFGFAPMETTVNLEIEDYNHSRHGVYIVSIYLVAAGVQAVSNTGTTLRVAPGHYGLLAQLIVEDCKYEIANIFYKKKIR